MTATPRSPAPPAPRTTTSSTASTRPTPLSAARARTCRSSSFRKSRSRRALTALSTASRRAASSTSSPRAAATSSAATSSAYFTTKGLVRETKNFPFTGAAPNGFSEVDAGFDIGGPIIKDKLWFFGAFNPQRRKNIFLTQTFREEVENKITTPFYSGKLTWGINQNHTFTFSTFGDFTKQEGFLFGSSGFGQTSNSFRGEIQTGGHNYTARLNSTITPTWIGEFAFGLHLQRANTIPESSVGAQSLIADNFAVLRSDGTVAPVSESPNTSPQRRPAPDQARVRRWPRRHRQARLHPAGLRPHLGPGA